MYPRKRLRNPFASTQTVVPAFPCTTSPHRRARPGSFRGIAANPLLSWVSWHWGRHLGYSLCPWHWTSTYLTCVHPSLANLQPDSGAQSILCSPRRLWDWDECLVPISFLPIAAVGSCWLRSIPPLVPGFHSLDKGFRTHSCTHPRPGGPRLHAGYLSLGASSWAHR